ncbi:hypothetical protein EB22_00251 [Enterococcus faecium]|nr:hypothetical protein EB22_00251 [Enterococcus faecium]
MFTMQDYIYEEKEVLSTILKKNDFFDKRTYEKNSEFTDLSNGFIL